VLRIQALIHNITPFDASIGSIIQFAWNGDQIFKVRCLIKENESGTTVYDSVIDTTRREYPVPAGSGLRNGVYYVCYITVFNVDGIESAMPDNGKPFWCFTKPIFQLSINEGDVIKTSAYEVSLNYSQAENEALSSYSITLYSYQQTELQSSGNIYPDPNNPSLTYLISGMENATQYYIKATGITDEGMLVETDLILFTVAYTQAQIFSTLELNNKASVGGIEIRSNIASILGVSEKDVIYIDGEKADLRDNTVVFDSGFEIDGDFTVIVKISDPNINKTFLHLMSSDGLTIECYYREGNFDNSNGKKAVIELRASSISGLSYVLYSNYFNIPEQADSIYYCINRIGSFFDTCVIKE